MDMDLRKSVPSIDYGLEHVILSTAILTQIFLLVALLLESVFGGSAIELMGVLLNSLLTLVLVLLYRSMVMSQREQTEVQDRQKSLMEAELVPKVEGEVREIRKNRAHAISENKANGVALNINFELTIYYSDEVPSTSPYSRAELADVEEPRMVTQYSEIHPDGNEFRFAPTLFIEKSLRDGIGLEGDAIPPGRETSFDLMVHWSMSDSIMNIDSLPQTLEDFDNAKIIGHELEMCYTDVLGENHEEVMISEGWGHIDQINTFEDLILADNQMTVIVKNDADIVTAAHPSPET